MPVAQACSATLEHMTDPKKQPASTVTESTTEEKPPSELDEKELEKVSGGAMSGDDDLEDLEVERLKRRLR
jgi:bacteriocin-like protein